MASILPYFYYDIVARMLPGGLTLAILLLSMPRSWRSILSGKERWTAAVLSVVLAGLSYLIGVVYEAINDSDIFEWFVRLKWFGRDYYDKKAVVDAWSRFNSPENWHGDSSPKPGELDSPCSISKESSTQLWERLVFQAAQRTEIKSVFEHCHRFQAEYKMFLHLRYPLLLLPFPSIRLLIHLHWRYAHGFSVFIPTPFIPLLTRMHWHWWEPILIGVVLGLVLALGLVTIARYLGYRRDSRRWWQVFIFSEQLGWIDPRSFSWLAPRKNTPQQ